MNHYRSLTASRDNIFGREIYRERGLLKAFQFSLSSFMHRSLSHDWHEILRHDLATLAPSIQTQLAQKIYKPYLRQWFSLKDRIELLHRHYKIWFFGHNRG